MVVAWLGRLTKAFEVNQEQLVILCQRFLYFSPGIDTGAEAVEKNNRVAVAEGFVIEIDRVSPPHLGVSKTAIAF